MEVPEPLTKVGVSMGRELLRNASWTLVARILEQVLGYVIFLLIANRLGVAGVGQYTFIYSSLGLALVLSHQGIEIHVLRESSRHPEHAASLTVNALLLKLPVAGVALAFALAVIVSQEREAAVTLAAAVACAGYLITAADAVLYQVLNSFEMLNKTALSTVLERLTALLLAVALLGFRPDLVSISIALTAAILIRHLLHFWFLRPVLSLRVRPSVSEMRRIFLEALPLGLVGALLYVYFRIDAVMLSLMTDDHRTGLYTAAYRLLDAAAIAPACLMVASYPRLARAAVHDPEEFGLLSRKILVMMLFLGFPSACGLFILSAEIVALVYGPGFAASAPSLCALSLALPLLAVNLLLGNLLVACGREGRFTAAVGATAAINVGLNVVLIPRFFEMGAAVATLCSEVALLAILAASLSKLIPFGATFRTIVLAIVGSSIMSACVLAASSWSVVPRVLLGVSVYAGWMVAAGWPLAGKS